MHPFLTPIADSLPHWYARFAPYADSLTVRLPALAGFVDHQIIVRSSTGLPSIMAAIASLGAATAAAVSASFVVRTHYVVRNQRDIAQRQAEIAASQASIAGRQVQLAED